MPNEKDYQDYYVTIKIDARAVIPVRATSYEEAIQKANWQLRPRHRFRLNDGLSFPNPKIKLLFLFVHLDTISRINTAIITLTVLYLVYALDLGE